MNEKEIVNLEEETGYVTTPSSPQLIWRFTFGAAAASLILNVALYFIGRSVGWIPDDMPESTEAFSLSSVIVFSILPVVAFGAFMIWLDKRAPRASRLFTIILLCVLILLVMVPFLFRDLDSSFRLVLVAMHFITAAAIMSITQATPR